MKLFYWTQPEMVHASRFYVVNTKDNYAAEVPLSMVTKDFLVDLLASDAREISVYTAMMLNLPT